jgi:hypothetical protein
MTDQVKLLLRFALAAVLFVVVIGGLSWLDGASPLQAIGEGSWVGTAAVLLILLVVLAMGKGTTLLLGDPGGWAPDERQVKKGVASLYWRGGVSTGLLILTDRRLRFCPHRLNSTEGDYSFAVKNIVSTLPTAFPRSMFCNLRIRISDGRERCFAVIGRREWCEAIRRASEHRRGVPPDGQDEHADQR